MKLIEPHILLGRLIKNRLPECKKYHYGNANEIKEVMKVLTAEQLYPLIWCELPLNNPVQNYFDMETGMKLFLATTSKKEFLNDKRQKETYEKVLIPLAQKLHEVLIVSQTFSLTNSQIRPNWIPNFHSEQFGDKNPVPAIWDVLTFEFQTKIIPGRCDVKIN